MTQQPRMRRRRRTLRPQSCHAARALTRVLALTLALAATGCGSSGHVHFAKTKFVLHAGLAFGAFHRYIYKPYKAGDFTPVSRHKLTLVKAGAAGLFAYHEIKIALVARSRARRCPSWSARSRRSSPSCTRWDRVCTAASSTGARSVKRTRR